MTEKAPGKPNVTIASIIVLCITLWNLLRFYDAIANWQILGEFTTFRLYILLSASFWILVGSSLLISLWVRYKYVSRAGLTVAGLYFAWYWCDRLIFQPLPAPNVFFSLVVSTILLVVFSIILMIKGSNALPN